MSELPTIYVVDDDVFRLFYHELLLGLAATVKFFTSTSQFLESYSPGRQECLICDLPSAEVEGGRLQREMMGTGSCIPVIFMAARPKVSSVVDAIKAGAFHFLEKPLDGACLRETVQSALEQSRELNSARLDLGARKARLALLTRKEREIVERVVAGHSSREISSELCISIRTVENHRARITEKLHVKSTVDLVRLVLNVS
jgi:two-component system response regulator FixJ